MSWAVFSVRKYAKCGMHAHRFYTMAEYIETGHELPGSSQTGFTYSLERKP